jgi:flagellar basal-body rod modification protein FlgD
LHDFSDKNMFQLFEFERFLFDWMIPSDRQTLLPFRRYAMTVSPTQSATGSSSTSSTTNVAGQAATVNYNQFLQLLVAELQNQDPTSPTNPTQYMSQLASFSSVEQQIQTNSKLDTMLTSSALSQAEALIGQTVTSADGKTSGTVASVTLSASGAVTATLSDGSTVSLNSGSSAATTATLSDGSTFSLPTGVKVGS